MTPRQVQLRSQPRGRIRADDFTLAEVPLPEPGAGEVVVRNEWMSVDPYMRLVLSGQEGFLPPLQPGEVLGGAAAGVVIQSRDPAMPVGTRVLSQMAWRSHFVSPAAELTPIEGDAPAHWHLGFLGLTGITAWLGIERVLRPGAGETVFVSGAAGAVGSIACQLARLRGARVLGSASSAEKARWLIEVAGVDAVTDYRTEDLDEFLKREAPNGLDCYFDNVGGAMLDRVLQHMKPYGRIGACGAMSQYQSGNYRTGPANFFTIIEKSLVLSGFNAFLLAPSDMADITRDLARLAADGQVKPCETIVEGLDRAAQAFAGLFEGGYLGKLIVRI